MRPSAAEARWPELCITYNCTSCTHRSLTHWKSWGPLNNVTSRWTEHPTGSWDWGNYLVLWSMRGKFIVLFRKKKYFAFIITSNPQIRSPALINRNLLSLSYVLNTLHFSNLISVNGSNNESGNYRSVWNLVCEKHKWHYKLSLVPIKT